MFRNAIGSKGLLHMAGVYSYEKDRVEKLRALMRQNGVDAFLIPPGPNFFYFSGLETEGMERLTLMVITGDDISVVAPKLMEEQLEEHTWIENIRSWTDDMNPYSVARNLISGGKPSLLAIDGSLPYFHYSPLFQRLRGRKVLGDGMLSTLRMIKDSSEIERISAAVSRSESALKRTLNDISDEITEKELATLLENNMMREGLDSLAFPTIVASGENSSVPHHSPTSRRINRYEPIVIDYGGRYRGYASDTTRTFFIDRAPGELEEIYEVTRNAQESTIKQLNRESTYADADRMAREVIDGKGYGSRFIHRLGHGLGISVHEEPYLVPSNTRLIDNDTIFTIEPGIYLPKKGGVRIEDTTRFAHGACVPFNSFSKELNLL